MAWSAFNERMKQLQCEKLSFALLQSHRISATSLMENGYAQKVVAARSGSARRAGEPQSLRIGTREIGRLAARAFVPGSRSLLEGPDRAGAAAGSLLQFSLPGDVQVVLADGVAAQALRGTARVRHSLQLRVFLEGGPELIWGRYRFDGQALKGRSVLLAASAAIQSECAMDAGRHYRSVMAVFPFEWIAQWRDEASMVDFGARLERAGALAHVQELTSSERAALHDVIDRAVGGDVDRLQVLAAMTALLRRQIRMPASQAVPRTAPRHRVAEMPLDARVRLAVEAMQTAVRGKLHIADLANRMQMSSRTLRRATLKATDQTPKQLELTTRLEHARRLLADSSISIASVSETCGFASAAHFAQTFKKRFGSTPSEWRREKGGGAPVDHTRPRSANDSTSLPATIR